MKGAGHIVVSTVQQWGWKTQAEDYMDFGLKFAVAFNLVASILYGVGNQLEGIYIYGAPQRPLACTTPSVIACH